MKVLLVAEYRAGTLQSNYMELLGFAERLQAETALFLVGSSDALPHYSGPLYLADVSQYKEYNPQIHTQLLLEVIEKEQPDMVVFSHSSYGWDLAPRVALSMQVAQISEIVDVVDSHLVVPVCNSKLRRTVAPATEKCVVTLQAGAFSMEQSEHSPQGPPPVLPVEVEASSCVEFTGYEQAEQGGVDLDKASVIVSGGRGIGKPENIDLITRLANVLGGEYGASRPVVDAQWTEHNRQVGTTGQSVAPKLYIACGISGAIQHLAGMKKSEFIVAVNTDKDAPITEVANISVIADLKQFLPILTEKLEAL